MRLYKANGHGREHGREAGKSYATAIPEAFKLLCLRLGKGWVGLKNRPLDPTRARVGSSGG